MKKRFKRNRKPHLSDEVSELPFKVFEEKLKKAGLLTYFLRVKRKKKTKFEK
jgi:hypothetical protein